MTEARILGADPRCKIGLAVLLGVLTWKTALPGLVGYLAVLALLCFVLRGALPGQRHVLKSYGWFLLLWVGAKVGLDLWAGVAVRAALAAGAELGLRLTCLLLVGLVLALSTSPRGLGMALAWFLRPVMGRHAWQAALALALMVHFLPITWLTLAQVRQTVNRRCRHLGVFRRMLIIGQASLRGLGQKTWNQTLAVACRGLDGAAAWRPVFHCSLGEAGTFACLSAAAVLAAFV